mgnify:CR=1 FL=1
MDNKKNNKIEITSEEALIDALSFICQKLFFYFDGKKTNLMPISQLLVSLALPDSKQYEKVSSEEIFLDFAEKARCQFGAKIHTRPQSCRGIDIHLCVSVWFVVLLAVMPSQKRCLAKSHASPHNTAL